MNREHAGADELRPIPGNPVPVLIVGNSLLKKGINISLLNEKLGPEYKVTRFVVEDTNYLDWYYGLHRLFREGARPRAVVLVLNARQLIAPEVHGDAFATLLMDPYDLLAVKRTVAIDNTTTSNLLFANLSRYYGLRSELHKWFLVHMLPDFPDLAAKLRPVTAPLAPDDEIDRKATERLREISGLCARYGAQFVFVVPPSAALRDGSGAIQTAGNRVGVQVFVPFQPQQLPLDLYSDGFHLNYRGASVFTDALGSGLRQLLRNDNATQTAASNRSSVTPGYPPSRSKATNTNNPGRGISGFQGAQ
ncbi:MAG: hypothetical protein WA655_22225 [Candidatus Korobacteraceae bacterium]